MATFKVGQRVKIVARHEMEWDGVETVITGPSYLYEGDLCYPVACSWRGCYAASLVPILDPKADAFLESLKKLGREPKPLEVVETLSQRSPLVWSDK